MKQKNFLQILLALIFLAGLSDAAFGQTQNPRLRRGRGIAADAAKTNALRAATATTAYSSVILDFFVELDCKDGTSPNTSTYDADRGNSEANPYLIKTAADLMYVAEIVNSVSYNYDFSSSPVNASFRKYFQIVDSIDHKANIIDLTDSIWKPIGDHIITSGENIGRGHFQGIFDGSNVLIKNMKMTNASLDEWTALPPQSQYPCVSGENMRGQGVMAVLGMFGCPTLPEECGSANADTIIIKNIYLWNAAINIDSAFKSRQLPTNPEAQSIEFGLLVGFPQYYGIIKIDSCRVEGTMTLTDGGDYNEIFGIGGLVADLWVGGEAHISNTFVNVKNMTIDLQDNEAHFGIGGFIGNFEASDATLVSEFRNCGARLTEATIKGGDFMNVGGFMGNSYTNVDFYNCYAVGHIKEDSTGYGISGFSNLCSDGTDAIFNFYNCYVAVEIEQDTIPTDPGYESEFSGWAVFDNGGDDYHQYCHNSYYLSEWQVGGADHWTDDLGWEAYTTPFGATDDAIETTNLAPCDNLDSGQTKEYMMSSDFVQNKLNAPTPGSDADILGQPNYDLDVVGFFKNYGYPVLQIEYVEDPQIIRKGKTVVIPAGYDTTMSDPYYTPTIIILQDSAQFINNSYNNYVLTVERDLVNDGWECVGIPINDTDSAGTFGWMSNDPRFFNGTGSRTPAGEGETLFGTRDYYYINTTPNPPDSSNYLLNSAHNYIVAYPYRYITNSWVSNHAYRTDTMYNGIGYMVWNGGEEKRFDEDGKYYRDEDAPLPHFGSATPTTIRYKGHVYKNDTTVNLTLPANSLADKWYAIANPFPYKLDIGKFVEDNTSVLADASVYVWDVSRQTWKRKTWNSGTQTLTVDLWNPSPLPGAWTSPWKRISRPAVGVYNVDVWNGAWVSSDNEEKEADFLKQGEGFMIKANASAPTIKFEYENLYDGVNNFDY